MKIQRRWFVDAAQRIHSEANTYSCSALYGVVLDETRSEGGLVFLSESDAFRANAVCEQYAQLMRPARKKKEQHNTAFWLDDIRLTNITRRELRIMLLLFAGEVLHGTSI